MPVSIYDIVSIGEQISGEVAFSQESEPLTTMQALLTDNWVVYSTTPLPIFLVANDSTEPYVRFDMNAGDHVIIRMSGSENIRYRGNIIYYDRIYPMGLSIWTKTSRQRLRNLYKVIRSICFMKKHNFSGWQLIRLGSYQEMVNESSNVWRGEINLVVENHGIRSEEAV